MKAVHIEIRDFTPEVHHRWSEKETEQELKEDKEAEEEERAMNEAKKKDIHVKQ